MARPTLETASPVAIAPALLRWAAAQRLDVEELAALGGFRASDAAADTLPVTPGAMAAMLERAAEAHAEPYLALRLPRSLPFERYDAATLAARSALCARDALAAIARFAPLIFPGLAATVTSQDVAGEVRVRLEGSFEGRPRGLGMQADAYVLGYVLAHCRKDGTRLDARRVWFTSPRRHDLGALVEAFGTEDLAFGSAWLGLELVASDAERPYPGADPMLARTATELAGTVLRATPRAGAIADAVTAHVLRALPTVVDTASAARALRMSERTLQRRLDAEGKRFSALVDGVREREARRRTSQTDAPLAEIAFGLGFSDVATFTRAFKRWTGTTPGAYRRARMNR